jgi:hypothetical protein
MRSKTINIKGIGKTPRAQFNSVAKEGCILCGGELTEMITPFGHHFLRCEKCKKEFYVTD